MHLLSGSYVYKTEITLCIFDETVAELSQFENRYFKSGSSIAE